jgi:DNA-binding MarR family transcriptional regulator
MSKGAVSKLLTRLEDKQLVTRALQEEDRRQQSIALSRAGRALVPALAQEADRNDAEYFGHLPPSQHRMILEAMQEIVRRHELKAVPVD